MELKAIRRNYKGADSFMVQEARLIHLLVDTDLPLFTAFDNTINAVTQAAYLASIIAAETVVDDNAIVGRLKQATEAMLAAMETAKAKYIEVKYYVMRAFPDSQGTQHEFGVNDYAASRRNPIKMADFLDELSKAAVKYQTQLIAAGHSATAIAGITMVRTDLVIKDSVQKMIKKQRPKMTEDRITVLNSCYVLMAQRNAAAQIVYATEYAKQQQFVYRQ
jgi:hypothetical protein